MGHRIRFRRIFRAASQTGAGLRQIERGEVDLVPLVQLLQGFERADLTAAAGGMQKFRFHP